jgi:ABC-2 type transport system ATP-binding protein
VIITLDEAAIGEGLGAAVPALSLTVSPGAPVVIAVATDERPLLVSMLLGGRILADSGRVLVDGAQDLDRLRRGTALVDTPFVVEPPGRVSLALLVAEEFSYIGRSTSRRGVNDFLRAHHVADFAALPIRALPPEHRVRLFSELAILRAGISALVVTSPERHGGSPADWYSALSDIAGRGTAVAIVTDATTRDILLSLGAHDASAPVALES